MDFRTVWGILYVTCVLLLHRSCALRIGSFNLKIFGKSKASKSEVIETIAKIISRYDIVLLMEVRDVTGEANKILRDTIEQYKDQTSKYGYEISDRLGRTKSKEEYIFVYRTDRGISVVDRYHYDDGDEAAKTDTFEREPFIVRFRSNRTVVPEFSLVAIHTNPTKALAEIQSLYDVYDDVKRKWKSNDIIIMGDLNADCSYVRKKAWSTITLRTNTDFYWPIGDDADTTVKDTTDCAYDRFIVTGDELKSSVLNDSARVFDFKSAYGLSQEEALSVSDHFPIELELKEGLAVGVGTNASFNTGVVILSALFVIKLCLC